MLPHLAESRTLASFVDQFELRESHSTRVSYLAQISDFGVLSGQPVAHLVLLGLDEAVAGVVELVERAIRHSMLVQVETRHELRVVLRIACVAEVMDLFHKHLSLLIVDGTSSFFYVLRVLALLFASHDGFDLVPHLANREPVTVLKAQLLVESC